jgi:hypothetical protein
VSGDVKEKRWQGKVLPHANVYIWKIRDFHANVYSFGE